MTQTRRMAKRFVPRLLCRIDGHDYEPWHTENRRIVEGQLMVAQSRFCRRNCGLPDAYQARLVPDYYGS